MRSPSGCKINLIIIILFSKVNFDPEEADFLLKILLRGRYLLLIPYQFKRVFQKSPEPLGFISLLLCIIIVSESGSVELFIDVLDIRLKNMQILDIKKIF